MSPRLYRTLKISAEIAVPILLLVAWQLYTLARDDPKFPTPTTIAAEFQDLFLFSQFDTHVVPSLERIFIGFAIAVVIGVAEERLSRPDAAGGFILDGFPRTTAQAEALDRLLPKLGVSLERCVVLTADEDELARRLLRRAELEGRSDDNEASIRTRMHEYKEKTEPLIAYYRRRGVLREVDGLGTVEAVKQGILAGGTALGLLPAHALDRELREGQLAEVSVSPPLPGLVMRAVLGPGNADSPMVDDLIRSLRGSPLGG